MIDSTNKKQVIAEQKDNYISIKIYSWGDIAILEEYLEDKLGIEIEAFKPIRDENGTEIGTELLYPNCQNIVLIQNTIDGMK